MADFDDRSGAIIASTEWGIWWQTMEEVYIEINCPIGTSAKEVKCNICTKSLKVMVKGTTIIEVNLRANVNNYYIGIENSHNYVRIWHNLVIILLSICICAHTLKNARIFSYINIQFYFVVIAIQLSYRLPYRGG